MSQATSILFVQPLGRERSGVRERLARAGVPVAVAHDLADTQRLLAEHRAAVCVVDLADRSAAISVIRVIRAQSGHVAVAAVIDPTNPAGASEALQAGATDLLPWPFDERDLAVIVANARDVGAWDPTSGLPRPSLTHTLFVQSAAMRHVMEQVRDAALTRTGVLVCGESGTGRGLTARAVHTASGHLSPESFVAVRCDGDSAADLELRLFGVLADRKEATSRTAVEHITKDSCVWQAQRGTLLLINIAEAPARVQMRLARLLRDREAWLVDENSAVDIDIRPIAACEPGIDATLAEGRLRRDLYDRLAGVRIDVPPLRRRREDLPMLAAHFLSQACAREGAPARTFSRSALALLGALPWHGNAKELTSLVDTLVRSSSKPVIQLDDVLEHARLEGGSNPIEAGVSLKEARARFERDCISAVLVRHQGRMGEAAKALGIQRTNLYRKVRQLKVARALVGGRR